MILTKRESLVSVRYIDFRLYFDVYKSAQLYHDFQYVQWFVIKILNVFQLRWMVCTQFVILWILCTTLNDLHLAEKFYL